MRQEPTQPEYAGFTLGGNRATAFDDPDFWEGTIPKRIFAYVIDICILAAIAVGLWFITIFSFGLLAPLTALIGTIAPIAYHTYLVSQRGATVGQKLAGLRIVDAETGETPSLLQALVLTCLFYISISFMFLPLAYVLFDPKDRFLHDIFSRTLSLKAEALRR